MRFSHLGLQQGSINALTQDNYGFVWIGTNNGLIRYDGTVVTAYQNTHDDPATPQGNAIIALHYGKDKRLWVGTVANGASYYDYSKNQFIPLDTAAIGTNIYQFFDDTSGLGIFAQTDQGLFFIDKKDKVELFLSTEHSESVLGIYSDKTATHAILETGQKLTLASNPDTPSTTQIFPTTISQYWPLQFCQHLIREPIQAAGGSGLFHCLQNDKATDTRLNQTLKNAGIEPDQLIVYDLVEDDDGIIWISSDLGLLRVAGEQVTITKSLGLDGSSLSSNKLSILLAGQKNTLFIGTQDQGLNILKPDNSGISYFSTLHSTHPAGKKTPVIPKDKPCPAIEKPDQLIWSTLRDTDGGLWVGNHSGLFYRPPGSGAFQDYSRLDNTAPFIDLCSVRTLAEIGSRIWIGTKTGLIAYNKRNQRFIHYQSQPEADAPDKLSENFIRALLHDEERNSLWVGTNAHGLNRIDLASRKIQRFPHAINAPTALPHGQVHKLHLDNNNRLWIGTSGGLSLWNEDRNTFRTIRAANNPATLSDATVHTIYQPNQDYLWLGTGNGLNLFNIDQFRIEKRLYEKDGLPNPTIYGLAPDNQGHYWLTTANGLSQFNPVKASFSNYYPQNDVQSSKVNVETWHKNEKELIYLGGSNGLTIINPQKLAVGEKSYPPVLTRVDGVDNAGVRTGLTGILPPASKRMMKTKLRNIRLNYTYPFFGDGDLLKSQYRLLPGTQTWSESHPGSHYVDYADLPPGDYDFQLRTNLAENQIAGFRLSIEPYFWETTWFRVLVSLTILVLTIFLSIYLYRIWSKFSAEQLTRQHYRIVEHELRPHLHEADKHLKSLLQSPRLTIKDKQYIRFSIMPLITKSADFIAELRTLVDLRRTVKQPKQLYMLEDVLDEVLLFFKDDQHRIIMDEVEDINIHTHQDAVYLLVKNLISNAIKYSPGGEAVCLKVYSKQQTLLIECIDQGIGISKDKRKAIYEPYKRFAGEYKNINGQGIGLAIVRFIVHTYQGTIHIEDNQPQGSRFTVALKGVVVDDK